MHSAILAATQYTPFVCIAYEHKTQGIMAQLKLSEYVESYNSLSREQLAGQIYKSYLNRKNISRHLIKELNELRKSEVEGLKLLDP
jgi:polysaccharide pyruvyl transferase WcaK-like protein